MSDKLLGKWKKVFENDLDYVVSEVKDLTQTPCMFLLEGKVGAGKTTILKKFFPNLDVNSPTYSVVNEMGDFIHADLYRVKNSSEITMLELPLYLEGKQQFFVEWGKQYLSELDRNIDPDWNIYLLEIDINEKNSDGISSRDYFLKEVQQ